MPIRVHTTLNEASDRCGWPNRHLVAIAIRYYVGSGDGDISWITEFTPFHTPVRRRWIPRQGYVGGGNSEASALGTLWLHMHGYVYAYAMSQTTLPLWIWPRLTSGAVLQVTSCYWATTTVRT